MTTSPTTSASDGFEMPAYNAAHPFSSFLPGIAGEFGKPMWVFYTNRGQCIASFGVRDKNGAMLEFHAANKAYALTPLHGFRTFLKVTSAQTCTHYEPFQYPCADGVTQTLSIHPHEICIEERHTALGLAIRVVYFGLPNETLPALVRQVSIENTSATPMQIEVLDGIPQVVPFGLEEQPLKLMSRTMEAFAEVLHVPDALPFFKLKVEPGDKPDMQAIEGGFFAFTLADGKPMPIVTDPYLVFNEDTSQRTPLGFWQTQALDALRGRTETLTACAFSQVSLTLQGGYTAGWDSYFGQTPNWPAAAAFKERVAATTRYGSMRRAQNADRIAAIGDQFALLTQVRQLDAYSRQCFLDNTLRGGQPVVVEGPHGARVFHTFTRKHGDMERDYNFFDVSPNYWSQGNSNFRDVNQNRRNENFVYPQIDAANIEAFFDLMQIDGNNPLVVHSERFHLPQGHLGLLERECAMDSLARCAALLNREQFSPGELMEALVADLGNLELAKTRFYQILGRAEVVQEATHGEGYWVDHWIYNLDLLESYAAVYPERLHSLLFDQARYSYYDNAHVVQPRHQKYVLRADGTVRQLHAVAHDAEKATLIAHRNTQAHALRTQYGLGEVLRSTLLVKMVGLMAVKASLLDPFGVGLEMEADKPGWCDALNGLPGLFGSSTHEAYCLKRWVAFVRRAVQELLPLNACVDFPVEIAALVRSVTDLLAQSSSTHFFPTWQQLATRREAFRHEVRLGVSGEHLEIDRSTLLQFLDAVDAALHRGLAQAIDARGLPVSYFRHEVVEFELLDAAHSHADEAQEPQHVRALRFQAHPVSAFLEGAVHCLRSAPESAAAVYAAVRQSPLFDVKLGMYRVNEPLDGESFEIGRSKIFSPGWLENESIFLHMHYKYLLEVLRTGLAAEFFADFRTGIVALMDPAVYGRSPLENSSFIASSRFPDANTHGAGFVARLSGATAEWISMVLHMGLGAHPFQWVQGSLRFAPAPTLAHWLFTSEARQGIAPDSFGFKLFGHTWVIYHNPARKNTYGLDAVKPVCFTLHYSDATQRVHTGPWLPEALALDLRAGRLASLHIDLA